MSDEENSLLTLVSHRHADGERGQEDAVATGHAYATAKGQRIAATLEFRRKDGSAFAMPYGYRPLLWWYPSETLLIEYPGFFTVCLTGTGLEVLYRRLSDQRVTWIRECDPSASLPVAVTRIEILRAYPSQSELWPELSTPPAPA